MLLDKHKNKYYILKDTYKDIILNIIILEIRMMKELTRKQSIRFNPMAKALSTNRYRNRIKPKGDVEKKNNKHKKKFLLEKIDE